MESVQHSEDCLSSSTPIQQAGSGRSCKRFLTSPAKEIDALSPIKASPARCNLLNNLNTLDNNCDASYILAQLKRNKILIGVSRKLRFTELSNFIDVKSVKSHDNDSGIGSEVDLSKTDDHSISKKFDTLRTDENCNVIPPDDNLSFKSDNSDFLLNSKIKNSKSEDDIFEVLDNRKEPSCLNKTKIPNAIANLDILRELYLRNCSGVLALILSCLSDEDLRKASYVSKKWREIVIDDETANTRRKAYIKRKKEIATGPEKENSFHSKHTIERSHKPVLLRVINSEIEVPEQPLAFTQTVGRFDSFVQEAENLSNEEKLAKCPKCLYPSKAQSTCKFLCTRNLCKHVFCMKCLGPYLDNHTCPVAKLSVALPKVIVGSKQSRRNLRRL